MVSHEELRLEVFFKRRPVAANQAVMGDDGLEDAAVVVGSVPMLLRQYDVSALVADEVFIVRRNQEVSAFAKTTGTAIVGQIEFPVLL